MTEGKPKFAQINRG